MKTLQALLAVFALSALPALGELVEDPETGLRTGTLPVNGATYTIRPGAALRRANLSGADLEGANLAGAELGETTLSEATLTAVRSGDITGTPSALPASWILTGGYLIGPGASLEGIDHRGAALSGAKFSGLDTFLLNKIGSLETEVGTHTHDGENSGISPEQAAAIQANTAKTAEQAEELQEQSEALKESLTELEDQGDKIFLLEAQLAVKTDQITTLQTTVEGLAATVAQLSDTATIQDLEQQVADLSERPTLQQVRDGRPGSVLLNVDSEAGSVVLDFTVEESEDLITWTPVEESGVSKTLTLPEGKRFYRFAH